MPKVNIVFFASLRETLKTDHVTLTLEQPLSVFELKQRLAEHLQQPLLLQDNVKAAIDYDFARDTDIIDVTKVTEVAFFPPVTGG